MKRFRNILIWVDDRPATDVALDQAASLARASNAKLTLAHAFEPPGKLLRSLYAHADEMHAVLQREWADRLETLAGPLRDEGLDVSTRTLEGKPFLAFTREVLSEGHDLLIKPAEDAPSGQLFGSTDLHLLRKCPSAVWMTNQKVHTSKGILALVDPDPEQEEINQRILQMASSLAEMRGTTVDVLHVWRLGGEDLLAKRVQPETLEGIRESYLARSTQDLGRLLASSDAPIAQDRVHLVEGDVRDVVPEFVRRGDFGLIVMGTVARTGIHGVLIGNTAEAILARVDRPVLTVKPQGFVSPVAP